MVEYTIREATVDDLPRVTELALRFYAEEASHDPELNTDYPKSEKGQKYLRGFVTDHDKVMYVVEATDLVGYASGELVKHPINRTPYCMFHEVFVGPDHRRRGIARKLNEQLSEWARQQGAKRMHLNVYHRNGGARELYETLGYQPRHHHLWKELDD